MNDAVIVQALRTPIGNLNGALSAVRPDDLAALVIAEVVRRAGVEPHLIDEVYFGCANQAGEDNRNVAHMSSLLAGLPVEVPGATLNRLCGSAMDAVSVAARSIKAGEADLVIAGGVESMSRAPFVLPKSDTAFGRRAEIFDTTIGWRFVNRKMAKQFGIDSMPQTADNVAADFNIGREDQDQFALRSQQRWAAAQAAGRFKDEIVAVKVPQGKGEPIVFAVDEHPRPNTTLESLTKLKGVNGPNLSVTPGNASGVNDGACALLLASEEAIAKFGLKPIARVVASATVGLAPRIMGFGPAPATRKVLAKAKLSLSQMDVIELNEAFAAQALAVLRDLGIPDDAEHVNPNGGAIAIGHPLGMSGGRLVMTAMYQLRRTGGRYALCTMCIGVGQGIATIIERV